MGKDVIQQNLNKLLYLIWKMKMKILKYLN
jgi:hypothetical protein